MKVLAINGSPRGAKGNTERILQPFLEGARRAGAQTEVVYLRDRHINHCLGCFTCWVETPGVCIHEDDMPALLEKLHQADIVVFATPLYIYNVSGMMKDFMDRMLPLAQPYIVQRGDHFVHPPRYPTPGPVKFVLISNAGFPERHHFSGLEEVFHRFSDSPDESLAGMIFCAGGELLRQPAMQESLTWYLEAARQAGREVVEQGHISPETQAVLDRPLVEDPVAYADMANAYWHSLGVEMVASDGNGATPAQRTEAAGCGTPLPPTHGQDSLRDIIAGMATVFNSGAAGDLQATIQFKVTGDDPGDYYLDIAAGRCIAYAGQHPQPTLTINTPAGVWMAISRGEMNGATALLAGQYSIQGDLGLLMRFNQIF